MNSISGRADSGGHRSRFFLHPHFPTALLLAFVGVWLVLAIRPVSAFYWWLENLIVIPFVGLLVISRKRFPLSHISYTLIFLFLILHEIGAHYSYIHVPIDWAALGHDRNQYDRVVHFGFGLLLYYPIREVFHRVAQARGIWGYYLPLDVVLSFSALYEIAEWLTTLTADPSAGLGFVGAQGDEWDAVKDIGLAGLGALIAMLTTLLISWRKNPGFREEFRSGFRADLDRPLGEVRMREWRQQRQR